MAGTRDILFRIFYSTSFTTVFLMVIAFISVSPADKIYQSYRRNRAVDIFIEAGAYVITALIATFLYASRLYTNRSVLRDIPKTYLPIEKEDLPGKRVHRLIEECLARSAVVAYYAKPRGRRIEVEVPSAAQRILAITRQTKTHHHHHQLNEHEQALLEPTWGSVAHPGWQSPAAEDMPGLEFASVVGELIDLVEAKAVSLAPVDPLATPNEDGTTPPDPRLIELLARPDTSGMRQYLSILTEIGVVPESELTEEFLLSYERARFSATPVNEREFKILMRMFAELLRSMQPIDIDLLNEHVDDPDNDDRAPTPNSPTGNLNLQPISRTSSSATSTFSASSVLHLPSHSDRPPRRISEDSVPSMSEDEYTQSIRTAPLHLLDSQSQPESPSQPPSQTQTPTRSLRQHPSCSRSRPSLVNHTSTTGTGTRFFSAQSNRPSLRRGESDISATSHRSARSGRSGRSRRSDRSGHSVIRLTQMAERDGQPFVIEVPDVSGRRGA